MTLWVLSVSWACDVPGLAALEREPLPIGPRIAALCPRPLGLHAALRDPDDFSKDVAAATAQAGKWKVACDAGLAVLPEGFGPPTMNERVDLWNGCGLERYEAFGFDSWAGATGPAVSVVLLAHLLESKGVDDAVRNRLLRAHAGLPEPTELRPAEVQVLGDADPLAAFRDTSPPRAVVLAPVKWPPGVKAEAHCTVTVEIAAEGSPGEIRWIDCDASLRSHVESALEASWFAPATKKGAARRGEIRLRYAPLSDTESRVLSGVDAPSEPEPDPWSPSSASSDR